MSKPRQRKEESHEDEERWLITYADMITLLMAFFIMMYSMSVIDLKKFDALSDSARGAFGGKHAALPAGAGLLEGGASLAGMSGNQASLVNEIRRELDAWLPDRLRGNVEIRHTGGLVTISMKADTLTFPVGEARLTPEVRQILDVLGPSLSAQSAPLLVEGHTCDLPINTARFPSNWELSAQRATNVMVYLIRMCGISPEHVSAVGYADKHPLSPNDSEPSRVRNRRVDIVVLTDDADAHGSFRAGRVPDGGPENESPRLRPLQLRPEIDLPTRYYERTGRRVVDTPASASRREVQSSCD